MPTGDQQRRDMVGILGGREPSTRGRPDRELDAEEVQRLRSELVAEIQNVHHILLRAIGSEARQLLYQHSEKCHLLSNSVRKKFTILREVLNAREREILEDVSKSKDQGQSDLEKYVEDMQEKYAALQRLMDNASEENSPHIHDGRDFEVRECCVRKYAQKESEEKIWHVDQRVKELAAQVPRDHVKIIDF
eukprot:472492-Hanusia_phi.AAC.1